MSISFSILYLVSILSFLPPLVMATIQWRRFQPPLALRFVWMNLSFAAFLVVLSLSYLSFTMVPSASFPIELFFDTLFFPLYAFMAMTFPAFLSELAQMPWSGPRKRLVIVFATIGFLIPLGIHSLLWEGMDRVYMLRAGLNGGYLPTFLLGMAISFVFLFLRRRTIVDSWKKQTMAGAAVIFGIGIPLFVIDACWPLFQLQWGVIPRGVNLHIVAILVWNVFFTWRWAIFPGSNPTEEPLPSFVDAKGRLDVLSVREREVALLILAGATNQTVAIRLGIKLGTVKIHVYRIFNKTGASSRKEFSRMLQP